MALRRVFRNLASNYVLTASSGFIGLILTPLLFHHLGAADYAILAFALVVESTLEILDLGVANTLLRYVSKYLEEGASSELQRVVSAAFCILLGTGVLYSVLLALLSPFLSRYFHLFGSHALFTWFPLALVGASLAFQLPCAALRGLLLGRQDFHLANGVDLIVQWARAIGIVASLYFGWGLLVVCALYPAAAIVRMAGLLAVTHRSKSAFLPSWEKARQATLRHVIGFASFSFLDQIVSVIFMQSDTLIAAKLLPLPQLAIWVIARRLPLGLNALSHQSLLVAYPIASATTAREGHQGTGRLFLLLTRTLLALVLPLTAVLCFWPNVILRFWVGPAVLSGVPVLRAFLVYAISTGLVESAYVILCGLGRIRFAAFLTTAALAVSLALGPWSCRAAGPKGLAIFYASVMAFQALALCGEALRLTRLNFWHWLYRAVLPSLAAVLPCAAWLYLAQRWLPSTVWSLALSSLLGFALFLILFERLTPGTIPQGWKARFRRLLAEV
jgi:O-antigen/teichoic acid export membrane protein